MNKNNMMSESVRNADWLKYDPEAYGRLRLYQAKLTQEQRDQIFDAARHSADSTLNKLADYCSPLNARWIFAVVDKVVKEIVTSEAKLYYDQDVYTAIILTLQFEPIYLHSPRVLYAAMRGKINSWYQASRDTMTTACAAVQMAAEDMTAEQLKAKAMTTYSEWQDPDSGYCDGVI